MIFTTGFSRYWKHMLACSPRNKYVHVEPDSTLPHCQELLMRFLFWKSLHLLLPHRADSRTTVCSFFKSKKRVSRVKGTKTEHLKLSSGYGRPFVYIWRYSWSQFLLQGQVSSVLKWNLSDYQSRDKDVLFQESTFRRRQLSPCLKRRVRKIQGLESPKDILQNPNYNFYPSK